MLLQLSGIEGSCLCESSENSQLVFEYVYESIYVCVCVCVCVCLYVCVLSVFIIQQDLGGRYQPVNPNATVTFPFRSAKTRAEQSL